jgi:adenine-specific DNA-methyltransferase
VATYQPELYERVIDQERVSYGEVFTRRWVVETLLDLVGYDRARDLTRLVLVEPSAGSGAFLLPAIERLLAARERTGVPFADLGPCIHAFDLQPRSAARCREAVETLLLKAGCPTDVAARLADAWVVAGDFLLDERADIKADVIVGNPPYIRLEDVPDELNLLYRRRYPTMVGRADVYVGFLERGLGTLKADGRLGFICADRWMRNQYGAALREYVADSYALEHVWTMHDVDAFESKVSAYPAITVLHNSKQGPVVVADTNASFNETSAAALGQWVGSNSLGETHGRGYSAYRLPHWFPGDEMWPTGAPSRLALIEYLNDHFPPLHDPLTRTRVGIGVATGADGVFITTEPDLVEPDRLLPLSMVRDIRGGSFVWSGRYLVNPWSAEGQLVDIDAYPRLRAHLEASGDKLRGRHTAKKNRPSTWYRTIDKVNAELTNQPKLLLQDMRTAIHPVLEQGGYYPHHNLYYVVSDTWDMEVLGGLLLSRVAQAFIEAYAVRMRGNTLRFQAQYLKKIKVPVAGDIPDQLADELRAAFRARDTNAATRAAIAAYGVEDLAHGLNHEVRVP